MTLSPFGVLLGGVGFTPDALRKTIGMLKKELVDKNAPFGVDLLLPQVARLRLWSPYNGNLVQTIPIAYASIYIHTI